MSGESIFSATGKPSWVAIIIASLALRASRVLRDRDVERRQQRLRLHLGQHLAPLGEHALDHQPRAFDVGLGQRRQRRRRLLQQLLVPIEGGDVAERADRCLGRAKARDRRLVEKVAGRADRGVAHPAGQQRLADRTLERRPARAATAAASMPRLGEWITSTPSICAVGACRRRSPPRSARAPASSPRSTRSASEAAARQQRPQRGRRTPATAGPARSADLVDPVGGQHARSAAVGDDRQAPPDRAVARGQALGRGEQLDEGAHAHRAGAAQRGIEHFVAADDRAAVGLRRRVAGRLAARPSARPPAWRWPRSAARS